MSTSSIVVRADHTAAVKAKIHAAGVAALHVAAPELLRVANETVPFEEGILAGSGEPSYDDPNLTAQVSYGGEAKAYAVVQHEDTTLNHHATAGHRAGRAKWLELAAKENAKRLGVTIGMEIKGKVG